MADLGFLQGLAGGLQGGVQGYESALARKRQEKQDEIEGLVKQAGLLESGYKIAPDESGKLGLVSTGEGGGLKRQLMEAQLSDYQNKAADRPYELASREQSLARGAADLKEKSEANLPQNIYKKMTGREAPRAAGLLNAAQESKKLIDALSRGVPLRSMNPFAGTTEAGLAMEGLKSALKQAGQAEDGTPGAFEDAELPGMLDSPEIRTKKLAKIQEDLKLQLQNLGVAEDPRLKGVFVENIDLSKAAPTLGESIRNPKGVLNKIRGAISGKEPVVDDKTQAQAITPDVDAYAKAHGISPQQALQIKLQRMGK